MSVQGDHLMYPIADALAFALFFDRVKSRLRGAELRTMYVGPWPVKAMTQADTEVDTADYATAFVKVRKHVWGYIISGQNRSLHWLMFDGHAADIHTASVGTFSTHDLRKTLTKLKPHARALFKFDPIKDIWHDVELATIYPAEKADPVGE